MIVYIKENLIEIVSIILAFFSLVVPIYRYLIDKGLQNRDIRFKTYHEFIKKLVQAELVETNPIRIISKDDTTGKTECQVIEGNRYATMQDRQIAIIFEFRNFPQYFEVTKRILTHFQNQEEWKKYPRIISEIKYTLTYIDKYQSCWQKFLRFIFLKRLSRAWVSLSVGKLKY